MISREYLSKEINQLKKAIQNQHVELNENDKAKGSYHLGNHLGKLDGLDAVLQLLSTLPAEEPPQQAPRKSWHHWPPEGA